MPSPTVYIVNDATDALRDFNKDSMVNLSSLTNTWLSKVTSFKNLATVPSAIFSSIASGLPASLAFSIATRRSASIKSFDMPDASSDFGFAAAICMAISFANVSSPPTKSTNTPILLP